MTATPSPFARYLSLRSIAGHAPNTGTLVPPSPEGFQELAGGEANAASENHRTPRQNGPAPAGAAERRAHTCFHRPCRGGFVSSLIRWLSPPANFRQPFGLMIALLVAATAFGELPVISLTTVMPPGGKSGTEVAVTITGAELDEANALLFSHPGISATPKAEKQFTVKIAPDVPVGRYDVRIVGKSGVSNPRTFVVGDLPEAVDNSANQTSETATEIQPGSVFNGFVNPANSEFLKFNAKQSQRFFLECATREIDSKMSPVVAVSDASGRELAASRNGGFVDFTAPADGTYLVRINDLTYAGGAESFFYRLALTTAPHVDFIFPPVGVAGTKSKFTIFGRALPGGAPANLTAFDGKPLEKLDVEIDVPAAPQPGVAGISVPGSAALDGFSYRLPSPQGAANPVFISLASAPLIVEQEPNNKAAEAQKVAVPCEIAGQFFPAGDVDAFTFEAKKGDIFWIEVFSQRLGLPTNPFLLVQREGADAQEVYGTDANVGGPRFNTITNDPATRLEVKEDGVYRVQVRDLFGNTRTDPRCLYRLSIHKEAPDFRLAAMIELPPKKDDDRAAIASAAFLRGGETLPVRVVAFRRDGFAGEIELSGEALPEGVACVATKILAGKNDALLLLTAGDQAARWMGPIRIVGRAKVGEGEIARDARAAGVSWNVPNYDNERVTARLSHEFPLAISGVEAVPISVAAAEDKVWEAAAGAKLEIPLKITRRGGYDEALKLKAFNAPAIEGLKEIDVDGKTPTATASIDLAAVKIPVGNHTIHFRAQTKGKFRDKERTITVFSAPIRISVK